jgi:hypothetical protein
MTWNGITGMTSRTFVCGFCGYSVASSLGFFESPLGFQIYICTHCNQPTYFDRSGNPTPGVAPGVDVDNVPEELNLLYKEARDCVAIGSHTAAVLVCRKILMNIAVEKEAKAGESFVSYVEYLAEAGYVPPNGKGWVDHIRKKGNEANHEVSIMSKADAKELITFIEMLLKFIYEFPARVPST